MALSTVVTPDWFATYGTPLLAGRDIDARDTGSAPAVVVVNEAFVRRILQGRPAIGETVDTRTVVGVVADQVVQGGFKRDGTPRSVRDEAPPAIYVPLAQSAGAGLPGRTTVIDQRSCERRAAGAAGAQRRGRVDRGRSGLCRLPSVR